MLKRFFKGRGMAVNLIASGCFVLLAVYGWGLTWGEVWDFLLTLLALIAIIMVIALGLAWILRKIKS